MQEINSSEKERETVNEIEDAEAGGSVGEEGEIEAKADNEEAVEEVDKEDADEDAKEIFSV